MENDTVGVWLRSQGGYEVKDNFLYFMYLPAMQPAGFIRIGWSRVNGNW